MVKETAQHCEYRLGKIRWDEKVVNWVIVVEWTGVS